MTKSTKEIGNIGELVAEKYLLSKGLKVLSRNWCCRYGEIDLIALSEKTLIFVEVKFVRSTSFCSATDLFNYKKRMHVSRTVDIFLNRYPRFVNCWRFDLICLTQDVNRIWVEYYKNALSFNDG